MGFFGWGKKSNKEKLQAPPPVPQKTKSKGARDTEIAAWMGDKLKKKIEHISNISNKRIETLSSKIKQYELQKKALFMSYKEAKEKNDKLSMRTFMQRTKDVTSRINFANIQITRLHSHISTMSKAEDVLTTIFFEKLVASATTEISQIINIDEFQDLVEKTEEARGNFTEVQNLIVSCNNRAELSNAMTSVAGASAEPTEDEIEAFEAQMEEEFGIPLKATIPDLNLPEVETKETKDEDMDDLTAQLMT